MKCKECNYCKQGWFKNRPHDHVCTGVKHPFVIENINQECTEYPERSKAMATNTSYERLLQNLNTVKRELQVRNDISLNLCIKYLKDAIFEVSRMNSRLCMLESHCYSVDDADCWGDD